MESILSFLISSLFEDFAFSSLIMLALVSVYGFATANIKISNNTLENILSGIAIGLIAVAILSNPINLHEGIFVDARWVLLSCCAVFLNWRIVVLGGIIGASYRYYQGGEGGVPGVYTIIVSILFGFGWKYVLNKTKTYFHWYLQYIYGVAVELSILGLLYVSLPDGKGPIVVGNIALPILVLFPIVSTVLSLLLQQHQKAEESAVQLKTALFNAEQSEQRLAETLDASPIGVSIVGENGNSKFVNRRIAEMIGVSQSSLIGQPVQARYVRPQDRESLLQDLQENELVVDKEVELLRADGTPFWVLMTMMPTEYDGESALMAWMYDVTARKTADDILKQREHQLDQILENSPIAVGISIDDSAEDDGQIIYANIKFLDIVGFASEDLGRINTSEFFHDKSERERHEAELDKGNSLLNMERQITDIHGVERWVLMSITPIDYHDRRSALIWLYEISEQKKAEELFRLDSETYAAMFDANPTPMLVRHVDQMKYLRVNQAACELFGLSQKALLDIDPLEIWFEPAQREKFFQSVRRGEASTEVRIKHFLSGGFRDVVATASTINYEGAPALLMTGTDITKLKEYERKIVESRDAAEEATKAKATFLATMSHEIRTPMGGVIGMVDLLQQSKMSDDQRQMINTVGDSAQSLLTIINDILDFSKIEAGKLDLEEIPISVRDVVEGAGEALAVTARNKNIGLSVYVDPDLPDALIGDQVRLRQILFNFGTNAIKFTEKGKVLIRADKVPSQEKNKVSVRFQVIDEGIGIPEEAQKTLFQAFSQVDVSTTRRFGGTGLGLTICQRLTEIMNGEIGVESVLGEGSTFSATVTLPIAKEHTFESDGHDLAGLKVLFVHHDDDLRGLTPLYLEHWGATVTSTAELDTIKQLALDAAKEGLPFDVICLGSGWPISKQIETVERLQADKSLSALRFVIACHSRVKAERKELDNTVYVDSGPLRRAAFIKSIAVAAGRASPEVEYDDRETTVDVRMPLTVAEAEAMGQLILLAEDNLTNQDVIRRQLTMLGYTLEIANDGEEALKLLESRSFAILLTDCHMPNMDGFEITQAIRKSEEDKDIHFPIVAVTASVMKEEVDRCFASGMDDFIAKPMEMKKLKEILHKWMPVLEQDAVEATNELAAEDASEKPEAKDSDDGEIGAIDPSALKSVFGDDEETFKEILMDFVDPAASNVSEIEAAFNDRSADGVARAAHKLKSSSRSVGATELANLCQTLETAGNSEDWDEIDKSAPRLKGAMQEVADYIQAL